MRIIILMIGVLFCSSCEEKKTEFVQSKAVTNLFLIKNPRHSDSLLKKDIHLFLIKNHSITKSGLIMFYKYTSNTEDFLKDKRPGGYFREYLEHFPEDELAAFTISKCRNDTTKKVGRFYYYGLKGSSDGMRETDTIIYNCN